VLIALIPSVLAILLSFLTGRAGLSLGVGALLGAVILNGSNLAQLPFYVVSEFVLAPFTNSWKLGALVLTLLLGGFSSMLEAGGGLTRIFRSLDRGVSDRKKSLSALAVMGIFCFFDGLANAILLGKLSRGIAHRFKVSRALLAYIVDSTSSAVACLVVFSTWTAYQLSLIQDSAPVSLGSPLGLLLRSIPFNVYSWLSLLVLFIVIRKNFFVGALRRFEHEAPEPTIDAFVKNDFSKRSLIRALTPLATLFISFAVLLYFEKGSFVDALAGDRVPLLLNTSALAAIVAAFFLRPPSLSWTQSLVACSRGIRALLAPLLILFAAWALSKTLADLGLAKALSANFSAREWGVEWLPLLCFVISCFISFVTGTSWGTLGLMMPLALPILGEVTNVPASLAPAVIGAIFGGAVFGDHCSPISDTTVVAAVATDCSVSDHARSQMPYALLAALASALLVYLPLVLWYRLKF